MDLTEATETILESFKGVLSEDFTVDYQLADSVSEIKLRSKDKENGKNYHVLVMESLPDENGGES